MQRQLTSRAANYHNLNSSTEGGRLFNFMLADLSGALGDDKTILERLEAALAEPPRGETGSLPEILWLTGSCRAEPCDVHTSLCVTGSEQ